MSALHGGEVHKDAISLKSHYISDTMIWTEGDNFADVACGRSRRRRTEGVCRVDLPCHFTPRAEWGEPTRSIGWGGREGGRTLILSPSLYFSSPSASLLSMRLRSMSLPQPKDFQERGPTLFLLIPMYPAQAPVKRQCLPPKLCTKCNFCRKIQF